MIEKIKKRFVKSTDTKRFFLFFRLILLVCLLLLFLNFMNFALSKYESEAEISISPKLAFFIVDIGTYNNSFEIDKILPSNTPYLYTFSISNFKDSKRINVNLEYDIELVTTTNLPLNFKLFKGTTNTTGVGIITSDTIISNTDGMYFRKMVINEIFNFTYNQNQTNVYTLWVEFPENYKYFSESYEGVLDLIEIKVNARQIV